ncbi:DUF167 domain-containing protein [Candidatus Saccharibacteria bacterium]|nr:DUF167 domain-containing protein [Candidatus Saccharibacteria bacterium]
MLISVTIKPGSKKGPLVTENPDGSLTVYLREKPHDGEANAALLKLLADHFSVPKTSLRIKSGAASRRKLIELPG